MKPHKKNIIILILFLIFCLIISNPVILKACITLFVLFVLKLILTLCNSNPFDRRISFLNKNFEKYHLSIYSSNINISLQSFANFRDLRTAICEYMTRSDSSSFLNFSVSGCANVNSDLAFESFSFPHSTVSFEELTVKNMYPFSFHCGFSTFDELTIPKSTEVIELTDPCLVKNIRICGNHLPILSTCETEFHVPSDFVISIPKQLSEILQSSSSWNSSTFFDPEGNIVNPIHYY